MTTKQSSVLRMLEVGQRVLAEAKSVVRFLGPFRHFHVDWPDVSKRARARLDPASSKLAERMDKALARWRKADVVGLIEHELRRLADDNAIVTRSEKSPLPVFAELKRRRMVELQGEGADEKLVRLASQADLVEAVDQLLKKAKARLRRTQVEATQCQAAAMPAVAAAENEVAAEWLRARATSLRELADEFRAPVAELAVELPALLDAHGYQQGVWKGSSVCAVLLAMVDALLGVIDGKTVSPGESALGAVDWEDLAIQLECEIAELGRRGGQPPAEQQSVAAIDFVFQRVLVEAGGQRLGFAQIFDLAKKNPMTAGHFRMATVNREHEKRIVALVGARTNDGWVIQGNRGGRGVRREFWAERLEHQDAIGVRSS